MSESTNQYATGKRKTAVARVWISPNGSGQLTVNGISAEEYFERATSRMIARQSLAQLELADKYDVNVTVAGGGHSAQAEAVRHGIARALIGILELPAQASKLILAQGRSVFRRINQRPGRSRRPR